MDTLLTVILFLVLFSYVFAKILPYLLKWFITRKLKDLGAQNGGNSKGFYTYTNFGGQSRQSPPQQEQTKEGEVHVNPANAPKKVKENIGEYVDYEDIK